MGILVLVMQSLSVKGPRQLGQAAGYQIQKFRI